MADFKENVDYTITDKSTLNRFHVELNFAFDAYQYLQNDAFNIIIHDSMSHNETKITAEDLLYENSYGLIYIDDEEITEETKAKQINESLIANKGLVIFFSGYKILTIIMIPVCTAGSESIGFYSSDVYIQFTEDADAEVKSINLFANLFPKLERSKTLIQNKTIDDPVLEQINIRPEYNFEKNVDKNINKDFVYNSLLLKTGTKDYIYVNTTSKDYKDLEVPVYISTISAYGIDDKDKYLYAFEYDWKHASSYLVDESTNIKYDIDYTVNAPIKYTYEPVPGYTSSIDTYCITQYIYKETPGYYKNKLVFDLNNIPNDILLGQLKVEIDEITQTRYTPEQSTGSAIITIYNPNTDYRDSSMLKYDFDGILNMEATVEELDWSRYETEGKVTILIENIHFIEESIVDKKATGKFVFNAWLDIKDLPMTPEQIKSATYASADISTDYYVPAPELIKLGVEITGYIPDYGNNYIKVSEPKTITVRIINNNIDYLSLESYPITWLCKWNESTISEDMISVDISMYDSEHYIELTISNLRANVAQETYNFSIDTQIDGEDFKVEPEITKEQMRQETANTAAVEFILYNEDSELGKSILNKIIPYEWNFMNNNKICINSKLIARSSYICGKPIYCTDAEFIYTNIDTDMYCFNNLKIDNLNQNSLKTGYLPINLHGENITHNGNSKLNFENNMSLQYNVVNAPKLYYYNSEEQEYNGKFINANNSVIGNDPFIGNDKDGGMIISDIKKHPIMNIPQIPVYTNDDITANIQVNEQSNYTFDIEDQTYYDEEKHIFRANEFITGNNCTITFSPGEYHFKSWQCGTGLTIIIPEFTSHQDYVKIFVDDDIQIGNKLKIINNNINRYDEEGYLCSDSFLMYTRTGNIMLAADNTNEDYDKQIGILVAPVGKITLSNQCIWKGSIWAKEILIQSNSEYHKI